MVSFRMNIIVCIGWMVSLVWEWGQDGVHGFPTGLVPTVKNVVGTKNTNSRNIVDKLFELNISLAVSVDFLQGCSVSTGDKASI